MWPLVLLTTLVTLIPKGEHSVLLGWLRSGAWTRGLQAAYTGMVSRFCLGQGVGESFKPANGIKQGCPLSVILLNLLLLAVWSAIIDEGGRAKAKSYVDNAYAMAVEEEGVKEAVRKTNVFLDDTDMEAKASKCAGLSSGSTPTQFQMQGGAILHKDEFRCLGDDIIGRRTPRWQVVGAVLTKRVWDALPMAHVYRVPLSFNEKCLIEQRLVLARALFGCSYAVVGSKDLTQLQSAIMEGIWGLGRRSRSNAIVCYLLSPTMVDLLAWVPHMRLRTFLRLTLGNSSTSALARAAWDTGAAEQAVEAAGPICGPIGLLHRDLLSLSWEWPEFGRVRTERDQDLMDWDARELKEWSHVLRESLRARAWREAAGVDGLRGIDAGVDRDASLALLRTPGLDCYLAGTIRGVMANSVLSRQRLVKRSAEVSSPECPYCCSGEEEDQHHMWWLCSRWSRLRSETARYVPHLDTWPECFVQCGIVTEGFREPPGVDRTVMAGQVQRMMALISMERCDIDKGTKLVSRLSMREKPEYPFGWRPDGASYDPLAKALRLQVTRKDHDELLLLGLWTWLRELHWPPAEKQLGRRGITFLELALDFEVSTGLDLIDGAGLTRRGEQLAVLLRQMERSSGGRNTGFLGCVMRAATSLAVLGGPELAGLSIQPVFTGGTETEDCLRAVVDAAGPAARTSLMSGLKRATLAVAPPAAEVLAATPALPPAPHLTPAPVPTSAPREVVEEEPEPGDKEMEAEELGSQESLAALNFGGVGPPPQQSTTVSVAAGAAGSITESAGASQASLSAGRPTSSSSGAVASAALSQASSSPVTSTTHTTPRAVVCIRRTWGDEVTPQHNAEGQKKRRLGLEREAGGGRRGLPQTPWWRRRR